MRGCFAGETGGGVLPSTFTRNRLRRRRKSSGMRRGEEQRGQRRVERGASRFMAATGLKVMGRAQARGRRGKDEGPGRCGDSCGAGSRRAADCEARGGICVLPSRRPGAGRCGFAFPERRRTSFWGCGKPLVFAGAVRRYFFLSRSAALPSSAGRRVRAVPRPARVQFVSSGPFGSVPYSEGRARASRVASGVPGRESPRYSFSHLSKRGHEPPESMAVFLTRQGAGAESQRIRTTPRKACTSGSRRPVHQRHAPHFLSWGKMVFAGMGRPRSDRTGGRLRKRTPAVGCSERAAKGRR